MSKRMHKELDKAIRQCIWGSSVTKRHIHLLRWDSLCRPMEKGVAGLRHSEGMNKALLAKLDGRCCSAKKKLDARL